MSRPARAHAAVLDTSWPGQSDAEPTRRLSRQLPGHRDPLWSLGHELAELVIEYVLDEPAPTEVRP